MAGIGIPELIIILVIVIVIFGAGRLGEIGGALGKGIREFRSATQEPAAPPPAAAVAPPAPAPAQTAPVAGSTATPVAGAAPVATAAPEGNKCPSCGTVNPVGQAFCGQCGNRLVPSA